MQLDQNFPRIIKEKSGHDVNLCYQCRKCTCGCPIVEYMDYTPTQIIHAARLGLKDLVLGSKTIWLCASCETCTTRCPQEVDVAGVMDACKQVALASGIRPNVPEVFAFCNLAMKNIRFYGRMYELGLMGRLKLSTGALSKDMGLAVNMLKKGKLKFLPSFKGSRATRRIFKKAKNLELEKGLQR